MINRMIFRREMINSEPESNRLPHEGIKAEPRLEPLFQKTPR
jgi:hypothetical protein